MSDKRKAYKSIPRDMDGCGTVWNAGFCLHEGLPIHRQSSSLSRVWHSNVSRTLSSKISWVSQRHGSVIEFYCSLFAQTQPCYWRNSREINKRDVTRFAKSAKPNTTLSENLSLFQSLQVVVDDETAVGELGGDLSQTKSKGSSDSDHICLKPIAIGALISIITRL